MPRGNNDIFLMHTVIINRMNYDNGHRYNYFIGPDRFEVERYHHGAITPVVIRYNSDPHHVYGANEYGMYHPAIVERHDDGRHDDNRHEEPARYVRTEEVPQRDANHQHYGVVQGQTDRHDDHHDEHHR